MMLIAGKQRRLLFATLSIYYTTNDPRSVTRETGSNLLFLVGGR